MYMKLTTEILNKMETVGKWQSKIFNIVVDTILAIHGNVNFSSLSRISGIPEKRFRRWFEKFFDFCLFNSIAIDMAIKEKADLIAAFDQSFIEKSGKGTWGRANFWNGCASKAEKGLELSLCAIVDVIGKIAYPLHAEQTPPDSEIKECIKSHDSNSPTRIDFYLGCIEKIISFILRYTSHFVVDGYFTKKKFVDGISQMGLYVIGKLRCDANLKILYTGPQKPGRGRPKKFDGKCNINNLDGFKFDYRIIDNEEILDLYSGSFYHSSLERYIKVVAVVKEKGAKRAIALLFSTDLQLDILKIYHYYKARFQIEFIFRDANQYTGLGSCQSRNKKSLHFHFNASFTALNLVKVQEQIDYDFDEKKSGFSMASYKARYYNKALIDRFFPKLDLDLTSIKLMPVYDEMLNYGAIHSRRF